VPKRINILPHIWTKDSFSMYSNKFINRNSMGYNGVSSPIVVPFYLDLQKINQYQLIITKCLKRTKTWLNPFVSIPINGISINEASHTVTFTSTSFEVSVR
jgi:hypothetical protein